ncbi:MAG: helicase-related protein [Acidobacteriaceae bacterium]
MKDLASDDLYHSIELCRTLAAEYAKWILHREDEIAADTSLSETLKATAARHLDRCRTCLARMNAGIKLLEDDPGVARAFRLMNEAMLKQQIHYEIASRKTRSWQSGPDGLKLESPFIEPSYDDANRKWYPFQLAFILMNLAPMNDFRDPDRQTVDLIWFPTGGGKTEAYLGLSAFTMFLRRLRNPADGGTCAIMRYTLRLLTTQQFQRASSLICACEIIRRLNPTELGTEFFSVGLWVGREVTPNTEDGAVQALRALQSGRGANRFVVLACPWCGAAMGPQAHGRGFQCKGYRKLAHPNRVRFVCDDPACGFNSGDGLPLKIIDEQIYDSPPTLLVGTVDKFAMLAFQPEARHIFGIDTPYSPPELIIQDELHLISGPLGSMVGHYETVVDVLCTRGDGEARVVPKIIASTATIARAEDQVGKLYGRRAFLFPPQALRAGHSFFAQEREDHVGRLYVGIFGTALPSHVTAQVRVMSALLQAPKLFEPVSPDVIDPYWTMMGYFNSLRELGHAATLIRADIREYLNAVWDRLGLRLDQVQTLGRDPRRFINRDVELTSRVQSSEIPGILQELFTPYDGTASYEAIDVCFATNMIQVGLDIPRLSLMTVVGQPKTTSEYIQASSRVGRDIRRPGLVVTNFNPFKPRDRSHYEHFRSYHQSIYRNVEPTSVTPFSVPVRERALHALIIILSRFWGGDELRARPDHPPGPDLVERMRQAVRDRVMTVEPDEWPATDALFDDIIAKWSVAPPHRYGNFGPPVEEMPLMYPAGTQQNPIWQSWPFATPSSMRNVDSDCGARPLVGGYGTTAFV